MLNTLKSPKQKKNKIRVGRGYGSHRGGHTAGRGQKGQKSRSGYKSPRPGFEGGSMPLARRLPKLKGFSREFVNVKFETVVLSLSDLNVFETGAEVNMEALVKKGLIKATSKKQTVKILANGKLEKKLVLNGLNLSAKAKEAVENLKGEVK